MPECGIRSSAWRCASCTSFHSVRLLPLMCRPDLYVIEWQRGIFEIGAHGFHKTLESLGESGRGLGVRIRFTLIPEHTSDPPTPS